MWYGISIQKKAPPPLQKNKYIWEAAGLPSENSSNPNCFSEGSRHYCLCEKVFISCERVSRVFCEQLLVGSRWRHPQPLVTVRMQLGITHVRLDANSLQPGLIIHRLYMGLPASSCSHMQVWMRGPNDICFLVPIILCSLTKCSILSSDKEIS